MGGWSSMMLLLLSLFLLLVELSWASTRLRTRIYEELSFSGFCFRRTNGSAQMGCTSSPSGDVGVAWLVDSEKEVAHVLKDGQEAPYVVVVTSLQLMYDLKLLPKLKETPSRVSGLILINTDDHDTDIGYSDDRECPNDPFNECDPTWNAYGSGNLFLDVPFPIFLMQDAQSAEFVVKECIQRFNVDNSWPFCSLQLSSHMHSAVDTQTCLRRNGLLSNLNPVLVCDKMADLNIFYTLKERRVEKERTAMLMTTIDTVTLFDQREMGGDKPVLGLVALLETARIMAKVINEGGNALSDDQSFDNVLFAFLYGESFDYSASSRLLYDIEQKAFPDKVDKEHFSDGQQPPLRVEDIALLLDVGQLFNVRSDGSLYIHNNGLDSSSIDKLVRIGGERGLDISQYDVSYTKESFPPSSLHSFLKTNVSVKGALLADFEQEFTNVFYHSILDNGRVNLGYNYSLGMDQPVVQHLSKVAETLAEFLLDSMLNSQPNVKSNLTLINELLHCYLEKADCSMFLASGNRDTPPIYKNRPLPSKSPFSQYVGVESSQQFHGIFTRNLLSFLTSNKIVDDINRFEDCVNPENQNFVERIFLRGYNSDEDCLKDGDCGECYESTVFRRSSLSPAFVIEDYDFNSLQYPAWAESFWKSTSVRAFIQISPLVQWLHLLFGVSGTLISFGLVLWIRNHSDTIFSNNNAGDSDNGHSMTNNIVQEPQHL